MPDNQDPALQNAKHLAARAVMAYRSSFPIETVSISGATDSQSGIVCDWTALRSVYSDDEKLIRRGFAFIYIGTIVDQAVTQPISENLRKELVLDMSSAINARETAVQWGLVHGVVDTNPFAHVGYKLASRLLRVDQILIQALTDELLTTQTLGGDQLRTWFSIHAEPLVLDELEQTTTF